MYQAGVLLRQIGKSPLKTSPSHFVFPFRRSEGLGARFNKIPDVSTASDLSDTSKKWSQVE